MVAVHIVKRGHAGDAEAPVRRDFKLSWTSFDDRATLCRVTPGRLGMCQELVAARLRLEGFHMVEVARQAVAPQPDISPDIDGRAAARHDNIEILELPFEVAQLFAQAVGDGGVGQLGRGERVAS